MSPLGVHVTTSEKYSTLSDFKNKLECLFLLLYYYHPIITAIAEEFQNYKYTEINFNPLSVLLRTESHEQQFFV
jgi:hypothetical protein